MEVSYLVSHTSNLKDPSRDNIESNIEKAINDYEESNRKETTIIIIGLKLFYSLNGEKHVHKMYAISEFSEYAANHSKGQITLTKEQLTEKILKRVKGEFISKIQEI